MKIVKFTIALFALTMMASCMPTKSLYSWRNYENTSYAYTKDPSEKNQEELLKTYTKMVENPKAGRSVVPPGICAELGYLYFKKGDKTNAVYYLQKEIETYPESAVFIKRIIDSINNQ